MLRPHWGVGLLCNSTWRVQVLIAAAAFVKLKMQMKPLVSACVYDKLKMQLKPLVSACAYVCMYVCACRFAHRALSFSAKIHADSIPLPNVPCRRHRTEMDLCTSAPKMRLLAKGQQRQGKSKLLPPCASILPLSQK